MRASLAGAYAALPHRDLRASRCASRTIAARAAVVTLTQTPAQNVHGTCGRVAGFPTCRRDVRFRHRMNVILLSPEEVDAAGRAALTGERAAHVFATLHGAVGDDLRVGIL